MMVQLGSNLSFVWRRLLAAWDIIYNGSKWRVGDGKTVGFYSHKWLPHPPIPLNEYAKDMRVCELLDEESRQWDRGKLETMFAQRTRQEILALPLDQLNFTDTLIWTENRAEKFIVKTAYRHTLRLYTRPWAKHSSSRAFKPAWSKIWRLNVLPKVRMFLWRACFNCLPTRENLHRR
uniref:Reverse transcriptase zinc-binding domain-containing protein n=1 Tax=Quercus lobata TaxID=97700 RepID=A0A7N2L5E0_QUELO